MTRDVQNLSKNHFLNFNFKSDTKIGRAIPIELIYVYIWRITALARQVMEQKSWLRLNCLHWGPWRSSRCDVTSDSGPWQKSSLWRWIVAKFADENFCNSQKEFMLKCSFDGECKGRICHSRGKAANFGHPRFSRTISQRYLCSHH